MEFSFFKGPEHERHEILDYWNAAFKQHGAWENNKGRDQTRIFAECFCKNSTISLDNFSLLDVGCALGDAMPVFRKYYPSAKLFGCDISQVAIDRCKNDFGNIASFFQSAIEELNGKWDVIYCSNVLEHFKEYKEIASFLLERCKILFIMTPYAEFYRGLPLDMQNGNDHKVTLYKESFNFLFDNGKLERPVQTKIIRCPKAWSPSLLKEASRELRRFLKIIFLNKYYFPKGRQIIFELIGKIN